MAQLHLSFVITRVAYIQCTCFNFWEINPFYILFKYFVYISSFGQDQSIPSASSARAVSRTVPKSRFGSIFLKRCSASTGDPLSLYMYQLCEKNLYHEKVDKIPLRSFLSNFLYSQYFAFDEGQQHRQCANYKFELFTNAKVVGAILGVQ